MRALIQRVAWAQVSVAGLRLARIERGLLVLAGFAPDDDEAVVEKMAAKIRKLRIFSDAAGKMNLDVQQVEGSVLAVSQFTLYGDARGGNRPAFTGSARPELAEPLFDHFVSCFSAAGITTGTGRFGADMQVELLNDGPVTLMLDSDSLWPRRNSSE